MSKMSIGRPPSTTREEIEAAALGLFAARGFEATTMDDIATAVGVGRRTLFFRSTVKHGKSQDSEILDIEWSDGEFRPRRSARHRQLSTSLRWWSRP